MFKPLNRRTFLTGMGSMVGLPLLDAMIPLKSAQAQSLNSPRLLIVYYPMGNHPDVWNSVTGSGENFSLAPEMSGYRVDSMKIRFQ